MTVQEMRELDNAALLDKVEEYKKELFGLRFQQATGQLENTARIRTGNRKKCEWMMIWLNLFNMSMTILTVSLPLCAPLTISLL